jgi:hypothetical protein
MDAEERARKRHEEAELLRKAARSTTPKAYQTHRSSVPAVSDADTTVDTRETYTNLFGAFTSGQSWHSHVASAMALGANGLAYVVLIVVLNLAQCSWWYEPGMYSDPDFVQSQGR